MKRFVRTTITMIATGGRYGCVRFYLFHPLRGRHFSTVSCAAVFPACQFLTNAVMNDKVNDRGRSVYHECQKML